MTVPDIIKDAARNLRKRQTGAEEKLWNRCRRESGKLKAYRQKPLLIMQEDNGFSRYIIVDFYFPSGKLVVELDGSIHEKDEIYLLDRKKEVLLENLGYRIIRFTNEEIINNLDKVIDKIIASFSS